MSPSSLAQKSRKLISWLVGTALGTFIAVSQSRWSGSGLAGHLFFSVGLILVGAAAVGRLWCSLYIGGYKTGTLVTTGPYSVCRHPLYGFSFLGGIGIGLCTETLTLTVVIAGAFLLYYPFVIRAEERKLLEIHGEAFRRYVETTPRLWPAWAQLDEPRLYLVQPQCFRRGALEVIWFIWLPALLVLVRALQEHHMLPLLFRLY